ncbi:hypothetical protein V7111_26025 [Neobacillus niacini]|uniref:hypothetical protein n=1 Tax=Neobacillus niacini TaxID=86668 RepID=UPI0030033DBC
MSLRNALFEIKEAIVNQQISHTEDKYIHELESKYALTKGKLIFYFNFLMILSMKNAEFLNQSPLLSKKVNRKWTKDEMEFMFQYIADRQEEGALNITEILDEIAQLINRGYQSVNYKYYSLLKAKEKKAKDLPKYKYTTISHQKVPVISTEIIEDTPQVIQVNHANPAKEDDLLDIISGLITNVQQLPGIQLNELMRSLYQLTTMAIQNQDAVQQLANVKSEIDVEKKSLQEKLTGMEQQLEQERRRNDELQSEVRKLAKEIMDYNQLGDAAKIQNLKSYNQRLNYIIDRSGLVVQVGS